MPDDLQTQLDELKYARAAGVTRVTHNGVTTEFRSLVEIDRIIAGLEAQLSGAPRNLNIVVRSSKGW